MKEFDKIIGYADIKKELNKLCDIMVNPEKYKKLGVTTPMGLLLSGDPGVGKTLMANCFIKASGRAAFTIRKSKSDGDFVKEIKSVFSQAAKEQPCIVFLDDMDKFANGDERHRNADEYVTVQTCIDELKGKDVFVIATVNEQRSLPDSLLRAGRFDKVIEVEAPTGKEAEEIISYYLKKKKNVADMDIKLIADILDGASCAVLETVVNEAGILAGFSGKDSIDMDDMIKACMRIVFNAPESEKDEPYEKTLKIAYHEAGHAVVAEMLEECSAVIVSVQRHDGSYGGVVKTRNDDGGSPTLKHIENQICVSLGGRAATEIVYGECDIGAAKDIDKACRLAEGLANVYCTDGFDKKGLRCDTSDALCQRTESHVHDELGRYYSAVKKILVDNRSFLDRLAHTLAERKTLTYKDIKEIREDIYGISPEESDKTYTEALLYCIKKNCVSVSFVQRWLGLPYSKAYRAVDWMESKGYVTHANGDEPRKVLLSEEEFYKLYGQGNTD